MLRQLGSSSNASNRSKRSVVETPEEIIRKLQKKPSNKKCADCSSKPTQYVNLNFGTFICTVCSGVHREFNHRMKGISHASFSHEDVLKIKEAGNNETVNKIYLAGYNPSGEVVKQPQNNSDLSLLKLWIRRKYVDQKWREGGERRNATRVAMPTKTKNETKSSSAQSQVRPKPAAVLAPAPTTAPPADLLDFFSEPSPTEPPPAPNNNFQANFGQVGVPASTDPFQADFNKVPEQQQQQQNFQQTMQPSPMFEANFSAAPVSSHTGQVGMVTNKAPVQSDFGQLQQKQQESSSGNDAFKADFGQFPNQQVAMSQNDPFQATFQQRPAQNDSFPTNFNNMSNQASLPIAEQPNAQQEQNNVFEANFNHATQQQPVNPQQQGMVPRVFLQSNVSSSINHSQPSASTQVQPLANQTTNQQKLNQLSLSNTTLSNQQQQSNVFEANFNNSAHQQQFANAQQQSVQRSITLPANISSQPVGLETQQQHTQVQSFVGNQLTNQQQPNEHPPSNTTQLASSQQHLTHYNNTSPNINHTQPAKSEAQHQPAQGKPAVGSQLTSQQQYVGNGATKMGPNQIHQQHQNQNFTSENLEQQQPQLKVGKEPVSSVSNNLGTNVERSGSKGSKITNFGKVDKIAVSQEDDVDDPFAGLSPEEGTSPNLNPIAVVGNSPVSKSPTFSKGQDVFYTDSSKNIYPAKILSVHQDDDLVDYYTILLPEGKEKQTDLLHLSAVDSVSGSSNLSTNQNQNVSNNSSENVSLSTEQDQIINIVKQLPTEKLNEVREFLLEILNQQSVGSVKTHVGDEKQLSSQIGNGELKDNYQIHIQGSGNKDTQGVNKNENLSQMSQSVNSQMYSQQNQSNQAQMVPQQQGSVANYRTSQPQIAHPQQQYSLGQQDVTLHSTQNSQMTDQSQRAHMVHNQQRQGQMQMQPNLATVQNYPQNVPSQFHQVNTLQPHQIQPQHMAMQNQSQQVQSQPQQIQLQPQQVSMMQNNINQTQPQHMNMIQSNHQPMQSHQRNLVQDNQQQIQSHQMNTMQNNQQQMQARQMNAMQNSQQQMYPQS
mmetsp:Transcript_33330/g.38614  ORF Transcript_33330/g.38614 Transcript_33330/m.38614 type:complete len:1052 (-) Transcript_33330:256-3411(-)